MFLKKSQILVVVLFYEADQWLDRIILDEVSHTKNQVLNLLKEDDKSSKAGRRGETKDESTIVGKKYGFSSKITIIEMKFFWEHGS